MGSRALTGGLVVLLLAGLVGGVAALRHRVSPEATGAVAVARATPAPAPRAEPADKGFLGVIIVDAAVDLAPRMDGRVESVRVQVGSKVRQGEVVATLDAKSVKQDLAIAEAELLSSKAEVEVEVLALEQARERLRRREAPGQLSTGAISEEEVSAARYEQRTAEVKLEVARARVQEQEARVGQLRQMVEDTALRAPFDGVVAGRFVHPGALVKGGQPLVHLLRGGQPQVRFAIPSSEVARVTVGSAMQVEVAERNLRLEGRVVQVAPEVDVASLMVFALADVERTAGEPVPAGTAVRVRVQAAPTQGRRE